MPTLTIKQILVKRDGMTPEEADQLITEATDDLYSQLAAGELPDDICADWFGLEPDYIDELL